MGNSDTTYSAGTSLTVPDIATLGQVFTPDWVVEAMLDLRQHRGRILEPSAGGGAFMRRLGRSAVGIEIDERIKCPQRSLEEAEVSVS